MDQMIALINKSASIEHPGKKPVWRCLMGNFGGHGVRYNSTGGLTDARFLRATLARVSAPIEY
jgi:hypothetical protein